MFLCLPTGWDMPPDLGGEGLAGVIGHLSDLSFRHVKLKLRHISGSLSFSKKFWPKMYPIPVQSLFENTMRNQFLY